MFPPVRQSISTWSSENTRSEHSVWSLRSSSLETCLPPSLQNDLIKKIVFLRFSAANRKTLILLEDRFVCCWNFSATYSGNHAMFCDNSTSHLNKIKMSPEILNKCSIEFCRPSSLSSVCSQNNAGPNIDFMIKIYMIRMCIYIYIHIRNHCSLLYETFSLKKWSGPLQLIEKMQIILDFCAYVSESVLCMACPLESKSQLSCLKYLRSINHMICIYNIHNSLEKLSELAKKRGRERERGRARNTKKNCSGG